MTERLPLLPHEGKAPGHDPDGGPRSRPAGSGRGGLLPGRGRRGGHAPSGRVGGGRGSGRAHSGARVLRRRLRAPLVGMAADARRSASSAGVGGVACLPAGQPRAAVAPRRGATRDQRPAAHRAARSAGRRFRARPAGRRRAGRARPRGGRGARRPDVERRLGRARGRRRPRRRRRRGRLVAAAARTRFQGAASRRGRPGGNRTGLGPRSCGRVGGRTCRGTHPHTLAGRRRDCRDDRGTDGRGHARRPRHVRGCRDGSARRARRPDGRGIRRGVDDARDEDRLRPARRRSGPVLAGAGLLGAVPPAAAAATAPGAVRHRPRCARRRHGSRPRRGADDRRGRPPAACHRRRPRSRHRRGRRRVHRPLGGACTRCGCARGQPAAEPGPRRCRAPRARRGHRARPGRGRLPGRRSGV